MHCVHLLRFICFFQIWTLLCGRHQQSEYVSYQPQKEGKLLESLPYANGKMFLFWWLPIFEIAELGSEGQITDFVTLYSPLNGSVFRKSNVPLVFRQLLVGSGAVVVKITLNGEEIKPEFDIQSSLYTSSLAVVDGEYTLTISLLAYDEDMCTCQDEYCYSCTAIIFECSSLFSVQVGASITEGFSGLSLQYPAIDLACENRASMHWRHVCRSSPSPAAGWAVMIRIFNSNTSNLRTTDLPKCRTFIRISIYHMTKGLVENAPIQLNVYINDAFELHSDGTSEHKLPILNRGQHTLAVAVSCGEVDCAHSRQSTEFRLMDCEDNVSDVRLPGFTRHGEDLASVASDIKVAGGLEGKEEWKREKDGERSRTTAWVTLVTSDAYIVGALTMLHSLHRACHGVDEPRDHIILATGEVTQSLEDMVRHSSVVARVVRVAQLRSSQTLITGREELRDTYSKLHAWNLTRYRRVTLLDADVLLRSCPLALFQAHIPPAEGGRAALLATSLPSRNSPGDLEMASCAVSLQPDFHVHRAALEAAPSAGSYDGGDLGLFQTLFTCYLLPPHLIIWKRTWSKFPGIVRREHVSGFDMTGRPKPWDLHEPDGSGWLRPRDAVDGSNYLVLYLEWWEMYWQLVRRLPPLSLTNWVTTLSHLVAPGAPYPLPVSHTMSHTAAPHTILDPLSPTNPHHTSPDPTAHVPGHVPGHVPRQSTRDDAEATSLPPSRDTRQPRESSSGSEEQEICVESWECVMEWYREVQDKALGHGPSGNTRLLVYEPYLYDPAPGYALFSKKHPVGLGNRFIQLASVFLAAIVTRRAMLVRWREPAPLLRFLVPNPDGFEWDWDEALRLRPWLADLPYGLVYTAEEARLVVERRGGTEDMPVLVHRPESLCPLCRVLLPCTSSSATSRASSSSTTTSSSSSSSSSSACSSSPHLAILDALLRLQPRPPGAGGRFFHVLGGILRRLLLPSEELQSRLDALFAPSLPPPLSSYSPPLSSHVPSRLDYAYNQTKKEEEQGGRAGSLAAGAESGKGEGTSEVRGERIGETGVISRERYLIGVQIRRGKWHVTSQGHANDSGLLNPTGEAAAFRCARLLATLVRRRAAAEARAAPSVWFLLVTDDISARSRAEKALLVDAEEAQDGGGSGGAGPAGGVLFWQGTPEHSGLEAEGDEEEQGVSEGMWGAYLDWWSLGDCHDAVLSDASSFGYVAHARASHHAAAAPLTPNKYHSQDPPTTSSSNNNNPAPLPVTVWNDDDGTCRRRVWGGSAGGGRFWSPEGLLQPEPAVPLV